MNNAEPIAPSSDTILLAELPEEMLENLYREVPRLRDRFAPYINNRTRRRMAFDHLLSDLPDDMSIAVMEKRKPNWTGQPVNVSLEVFENMTMNVVNISRPLQHTADGNMSRHIRGILDSGYKTSDCFVCGLFEESIPTNTICHDAFHSPDKRYSALLPYLQAACYKTESFSNPDLGTAIYFAHDYEGGCFKRYLDIGKVYTQRGCRKGRPMVGNSKGLATLRFARLELRLRKLESGCLVSPHASITPFARSISLFARYHVCVCRGAYCNTAPPSTKSHMLFSSMIVYLLYVCI